MPTRDELPHLHAEAERSPRSAAPDTLPREAEAIRGATRRLALPRRRTDVERYATLRFFSPVRARANARHTSRSTSCANGMPSCAAASGSRLLGVKPGIEFSS